MSDKGWQRVEHTPLILDVEDVLRDFDAGRRDRHLDAIVLVESRDVRRNRQLQLFVTELRATARRRGRGIAAIRTSSLSTSEPQPIPDIPARHSPVVAWLFGGWEELGPRIALNRDAIETNEPLRWTTTFQLPVGDFEPYDPVAAQAARLDDMRSSSWLNWAAPRMFWFDAPLVKPLFRIGFLTLEAALWLLLLLIRRLVGVCRWAMRAQLLQRVSSPDKLVRASSRTVRGPDLAGRIPYPSAACGVVVV